MTIQEYIKVAINGTPKADFIYYQPFFACMDCEHCIYNGYACRRPKGGEVCIEYRVEKNHKEFEKPYTRHEKKV